VNYDIKKTGASILQRKGMVKRLAKVFVGNERVKEGRQ
jgi:hypothetical protein